MASSSLQALLVRAGAALERGRGAEAAQMLAPALRSSLTRDEELTVRSMQAEAALLQDDLDAAAAALGRPPDTFRDTVGARRVATLWRLHGRLASARGDQSRAIAMHARALKNAEAAHDSRGIGLAHYELGQCYRQVGDIAIVREHISKAASALHAAGDRRHLALVHSLSGISLAQLSRYEEAMGALRQAERLASMVHADDVLATVCGNQANVMMMQHRHEQALALAERSVSLHEAHGSGHGLAVALATLGQICVRLGDLVRAEDALHRALDVRSRPRRRGRDLLPRGGVDHRHGAAVERRHDLAIDDVAEQGPIQLPRGGSRDRIRRRVGQDAHRQLSFKRGPGGRQTPG